MGFKSSHRPFIDRPCQVSRKDDPVHHFPCSVVKKFRLDSKPMSGRPKRACDKCTAQKASDPPLVGTWCRSALANALQLRCSGQRPSCQRCLRLRRPCSYSRESSGVCTPTGRREFNEPLPPPAPTISQPTYLGIPSALVGPLVDTYFTYAYNASLLMHRGNFTEALTANAVRPEILLSICAFAAKYAPCSTDQRRGG